MGLFSFVGKAVKGLVKGVAKTAIGVAKSTALGAANAATGGLAGKAVKTIGGIAKLLKQEKKRSSLNNAVVAIKTSMPGGNPVLKLPQVNPQIVPGVTTGDGSMQTMPGGAPLPGRTTRKTARRTSKRRAPRRRSTAKPRSAKKRSAGYVTYKGKRYTKKQARFFVPSRRR